VRIGFKPLMSALFWTFLALATPPPLAASTDEPTSVEGSPAETVRSLEQMLIENMKAGERMSYQDRFETLLPTMERVLAIEPMARFLFGKDTWQSTDEEQKSAFRELFLKLSASDYAHSFDQYNGQRFEPVSSKVQSPERALVRRELRTAKGERVQFDYLLTPTDGHWKIVVIMTDGVSQLSIKRSQYRRLLEQSGFQAVLDSIREIIDRRAGDA